ncbi:MAG: choice-of-anchor D domain-containing protein [Deltaproteobacteria bacterium]|nr:choice-of-anchor D domain-containing protein [Deltaproteobacteria bacterium]
MRRFGLVGLVLLHAACGSDGPQKVLEPPKPGIVSSPRWLTFRCVEPGCDETLTATVKVIGDRDVAIKRVVLSDDERTDFSFEPTKEPPFVLKAREEFAVDVRFRPDGDPRLGDINLLVTYTDASASESSDRIPAGELQVPLVRRLVGEPTMEVTPLELSFGAVSTTTSARLPLNVRNSGSGNVGLVIAEASASEEEITVANLPLTALLPGTSHPLSVVYAPIDERYTDATVTVRTADPEASPVVVKVRGTSIPYPSLTARPEAGLDFGEVPVGTSGSLPVELVNRGRGRLLITAIELVNDLGGALTLTLPRVRTDTSAPDAMAVLRPLETYELTVDLMASSRGAIASQLRVTSNDHDRQLFDLPIVGLITEPAIEVTPMSADFGAVPRGWVQSRPIGVQNAGYGELVVNNISFVLGSSELFNFKTVPQLPAKLGHGERIGFEVEFRSETEASFNATLGVESNDPNTPFVEVTLHASGASCDAGCPIINGTPSCAGGVCSVGTCNTGYYDADGLASSGCECAEIGSDPGAFCAESANQGTLSDEGDRSQFTGVVPTSDDIDLVRFFGRDDSQLFSDDYRVEITLQSADPGVRMCIYKHKTGDHDNNCYFDEENCPGNRAYSDDGSTGPDDSADYVVKVFRDPGVPGSCTAYTVFMKNG